MVSHNCDWKHSLKYINRKHFCPFFCTCAPLTNDIIGILGPNVTRMTMQGPAFHTVSICKVSAPCVFWYASHFIAKISLISRVNPAAPVISYVDFAVLVLTQKWLFFKNSKLYIVVLIVSCIAVLFFSKLEKVSCHCDSPTDFERYFCPFFALALHLRHRREA